MPRAVCLQDHWRNGREGVQGAFSQTSIVDWTASLSSLSVKSANNFSLYPSAGAANAEEWDDESDDEYPDASSSGRIKTFATGILSGMWGISAQPYMDPGTQMRCCCVCLLWHCLPERRSQ